VTYAIQVKNLSKKYRLGVLGYGSLQKDLVSWWARLRGKEDPNALLAGATSQLDSKGEFKALEDVSFDVPEGEVLGIIGHNGAGKSTILKILSGITSPTEGEITLRGRLASLLEVGTGFHPELTGRDNIFINGAILGMTKREISRKFDEIVDFSGIGQFIDTPVKRYSSGMYVRLAFAVAAHLEAEILLIDEVLAVGDAEFQKKCLGKMGEVARGGRTVLFVSHQLAAVQNLCSKVIWLKQGRLLTSGPPDTVIADYIKAVSPTADSSSKEALAFNQEQNIKLASVAILDEYGKDRGFGMAGSPCSLQLSFWSMNEIKAATVYIIINDAQTKQLCLLSNKLTGQRIDIPKGDSEFTCNMNKLPLQPGEYTLTIRVFSDMGTVIYLPVGILFRIVDGDFFGSGILIKEYWAGPLLIEHDWKQT